jgi:4-amino-4-deoxy-L-arabinose transferase-like glycosyltransferase
VAAPTVDHERFGWEVGWTARSVALGHGFGSPFLPWTGPTALVPPLYTYLLALIFRLFGLYSTASAAVILSLNSIFSALTCVPLYFTVKRTLGDRVARLAGWAWVVSPFAIYFSADRVWEYALTALLFATCFWAAQELDLRESPLAWLGFGLLFGITCLSNPSVITTLPFLLLIPALKLRRTGGPWLRNGLIASLAFVVVCVPWTIRNQHQMHAETLIRDGFWLEFWAGNTGDTSNSNPGWAHPASNPVEMQLYRTLGETAYLAQKHQMAIAFVEHHPLFFAAVSVRRAVRFWTGFWSFRRGYLSVEPLDVPNFFFCTSLTLLMLRGLRRWWIEDRSAALPYLLLIAVFPFTYYFTHSSMDYRQPIEPQILILVVIGIFGLGTRNGSSGTPEYADSANKSSDDRILVGA